MAEVATCEQHDFFGQRQAETAQQEYAPYHQVGVFRHCCHDLVEHDYGAA
jgi:hypothetical protein